jgi:hypothetical protein
MRGTRAAHLERQKERPTHTAHARSSVLPCARWRIGLARMLTRATARSSTLLLLMLTSDTSVASIYVLRAPRSPLARATHLHPVPIAAFPCCAVMLRVRCGGDGNRLAPGTMPPSGIAPSLEEPDDGLSYMSYSEFDAGLVCVDCMKTALLRGGDSVNALQFTSAHPPLGIEQTVLPTIGSSVQICGLTSAEGRPLNGRLGTVIALEASGRLRVRVIGRGAAVEKAIKRECTRLTLLSPPFVEEQQRGTIHLHSLVWQAPPPFVDVGDYAPSARATNGSDEHSSTSSASTRAYVAGYCTRGEPTQTRNRRGGGTKSTQKITQEDLA